MSEEFTNKWIEGVVFMGSIFGGFALITALIFLSIWFFENIAPRLTDLITSLLDKWIEDIKKDLK